MKTTRYNHVEMKGKNPIDKPIEKLPSQNLRNEYIIDDSSRDKG
jgi:hypothetical protein